MQYKSQNKILSFMMIQQFNDELQIFTVLNDRKFYAYCSRISRRLRYLQASYRLKITELLFCKLFLAMFFVNTCATN